MSAPYRLTELARDDMREIWQYIARDNPQAAESVLESFRERFALLASQHLMGQPRPDLREGVRCSPVGNYVVYYELAAGLPTIVRVLHGARDASRLL